MPGVELATTTDALLDNARRMHAVREALRGVDRVHAWSARSFELARWLGARLKVPACGTMHDHPAAAFHGRVRRAIMRWAAGGFGELACVSDAVARACREARYRCPLKVIHNGMRDHPVARRDAPAVRIGFLGMYATWKGFDIVADWMRKLDRPGVRWQLYGEAAEASRAAATALAREKPEAVRLMGNRPREEIFGDLDVLVHASTRFDPLPTVLIEAAQAGLPVVAASLGGAPEIVEAGATGFLFDPRDPASGLGALRRLVDHPALRSQVGRRARARYEEQFPVSRMVSRYRELWKSAQTR
jgi:glycosyltransferase involved in cell wall biosynthesis